LTVLAAASLSVQAAGAQGDAGRTAPGKPFAVARASDTLSISRGGTQTRPIRVERFEPDAPGKHPAILLLHGVDGAEGEAGKTYRDQAERYARKGYVVLLPHYFDRSGGGRAGLEALKGRFRGYYNPRHRPQEGDRRALKVYFDEWADTLRQILARVRERPNVDARRVGLAGVSLGACLALALAAEDNPRDRKIAAVVELFGCLPADVRANVKSLPPTLMIHGDLDDTVPPREVYQLERVLSNKNLPIEFKMYQRMDHGFEGATPIDLFDALRRIEVFLARHLPVSEPKVAQK
jgi:carboxymethylenebutenolidase